MIHVSWKDRYSIGYKEIDEQHKGLLETLNQLADLIGGQQDPEQVGAIYSSLCQYAIQHFRTEEKYLQAAGYEGLDRQRNEHGKFIDRLLELDAAHEASDPLLLEKTMGFLRDWFVEHIIKSDQGYAACVKTFRERAEIRGVIFDFGKVVSDYDNHRILEPLASICDLPMARLEAIFQEQAPLLGRFEAGAIAPEPFLAEISRLLGHSFTESEFVPIFTGIFTPIQSTIDLIKLLKQRYRIGLISNTNLWHFQHGIQASEAFPLFDAVTTSFQVGALKPEPRIYQDCLEKLDLMAEECVFIDDVEAFAQGATDHLMHGIHYKGHQDLLRQLRTLKVSFWKA